MSLGLLGLVLLAILVLLCWTRSPRTITTAILALLLGVIIAGSHGILAEPSRDLIDWIRDNLDDFGRWLFEKGGRS